MKYYLGSCEYKWTHVDTRTELIWIHRELGNELFEQCNQDGFNLVYDHSPSLYLRKIYVEITDTKNATLFILKNEIKNDYTIQ
jgi:hypothetical protein